MEVRYIQQAQERSDLLVDMGNRRDCPKDIHRVPVIESLSTRSSCFKTLCRLSVLVLCRTQVSWELGVLL